jgi:hypothetical protein
MNKQLVKMLQSDQTGRFKGLTPAQRAAALVESGKPELD